MKRILALLSALSIAGLVYLGRFWFLRAQVRGYWLAAAAVAIDVDKDEWTFWDFYARADLARLGLVRPGLYADYNDYIKAFLHHAQQQGYVVPSDVTNPLGCTWRLSEEGRAVFATAAAPWRDMAA